MTRFREGGGSVTLAFQIPKRKKKKKKRKEEEEEEKKKKTFPKTPKRGRQMKLKHPIGLHPARPMAAERSALPARARLVRGAVGPLAGARGGGQRLRLRQRRRRGGRGGSGEAQGFPAISHGACRGRAAVARRSQEQRPRSRRQRRGRPPRPQAAAGAAAQDHGGGAGWTARRGPLRLCGRTAPEPGRGALLGLVPEPDRGHRWGRGGGCSSQIQAAPGDRGTAARLPAAPFASAAAATPAHLGRHRIAQSPLISSWKPPRRPGPEAGRVNGRISGAGGEEKK